MPKLAQSTVKYTIKASLKAEGYVEKPDIIGAIFGQTEGLLGQDLELRELQKTGRIGRIEVNVRNSNGNSEADILIPSSLDAGETALIGASLETIERIGPCNAKITVGSVDDVRVSKRNFIVERAKVLLRNISGTSMDSETLCEKLKEDIRAMEIREFKGLPCGSLDSDELIIVEGRADVLVLLKNGIKNVIAIEGTSVPQAISEISKEKITTAFLDGDRGGDLIMKELSSKADIDFVSRAPWGKEVEDLSKKEIFKSLREKAPLEQALAERKIRDTGFRKGGEEETHKPVPAQDMKKVFRECLDSIVGTKAACILDHNMKVVERIPIKDLPGKMKGYAVVLDGLVEKDILSLAEKKGISYLVANDAKAKSGKVKVMTRKALGD